MKKLYLVDVSSMFFRAFYAVRPLTSPAGVPVNAVYGFLSMLTKLLKEERPEYLVFCYDRKEPSFRKDLYTEYKANRSAMPEDLATQIPYIKRLADELGVPSIEAEGYEADDLIGTLARRGCEAGMEVLIVSGDKDFGQLVNEKVFLYDTMKDVRYTPALVKEKWGVRPDQMIDYLSIVGDSSDNIPGVTGIGPKGAIKLLEQFSTLEEILASTDKVESKSIREKLVNCRDQALLSKRLVTIVTDVKLPEDLEEYRLRPMRREGLQALLQELNFKTFEKNLLGDGGGVTAVPAVDHRVPVNPVTAPAKKKVTLTNVVDGSEVTLMVNQGAPIPPAGPGDFPELPTYSLPAAELLAKLPEGSQQWGFFDDRGLFISDEKTIYALEGDVTSFGPGADSKKIRWSAFDLKSFWHRIGSKDPIGEWDSMLAAYSVEAGDCSDQAKVMQMYMGTHVPELAPPSQWISLNVELRTHLQEKLKERNCEKVYSEYELPLAKVLLRMENKGIRIDRELLFQQSKELTEEIAVLEKEVHALAGESFNVGSPKQLGHILFEKLGLEAGKKTKTGYSTGIEVLEKINHPIAKAVLNWRELSKLKSTYVDALPPLADADGRVHTTFKQALAATGRLSSTDPNLQNIPVRTERGQRVRRAFIAAPGKKLLSVDYSQVELRILAHISQDPGLRRAFADDLDIHTATAAEVFSVPLKEVTSDQRRTAKAVNFGIAYGQAAFGLAENLGIARGEAQEIIKRYFEKFKGVQDYIESTTKQAHEQGYVETLFGRRRYIPELASKNQALRKFGERAAINAPIQGTASDLIKLAMIRVNEQVPVDSLLQVHDELIFEGTVTELEKWAPKILEIMEGVAKLSVPLKANHAIGENWDEAH